MAAGKSECLHLFGIRHHGPGSARGVLAALDAADPSIVLIEGPPDADAMIPFAASPRMVPPVALLVHAQEDPANASFYPFAVFSPEWQALRWALAKGRPVRFIDLPSSVRLAIRAEELKAQSAADAAAEASAAGGSDEETSQAVEPEQQQHEPQGSAEFARIRRDPLAYLAEIAGYEDSETWWNALVEQGALARRGDGIEIFAAIEQAMTALRDSIDPLDASSPAEALVEQQREAHMRLAIASAMSETDGAVAVVCGAWHVPALRRKATAKDDRALLKGLPRIKVTVTWVPWTETRLAAASGYSAGVVSPGWYAHLWGAIGDSQHAVTPVASDLKGVKPDAGGGADFTSRWQAKVAALLRRNGLPASTASVIEASRLAMSLAALRDLALPGLEEMREASLATLCSGEIAPLRLIEAALVVGSGVGEIDDSVPQMPLAADLARWQRKLKMKPEALDTDISLDLRSEAGLAKSLLLHRLTLLGVPWGVPTGAGSSRGSFRENWRLRWEPEHSVKLAEALVYGTTLAVASGNAAVAAAAKATTLDEISRVVCGCLNAGLEEAANATISRLQRQAAASSDVGALAAAVPPLAEVLRYGTAREMPQESLRLLVRSLAEAVAASLVYACRSLQSEAADELRKQLSALDVAMGLIDDSNLSEAWHRALGQVAADASAHPMLAGFAQRTLYDHGILDADATALRLSRALSPAVPPLAAGDWLDGFLGASGQILLHDNVLRAIIDAWLLGLDEEDLTNLLPMLRRGFSSFDKSERRRLLDEVSKMPLPSIGIGDPHPVATVVEGPATEVAAPGFAAALPLLLAILGASRRGPTPA